MLIFIFPRTPEAVHFCCEDEVTLRQSLDRVSPDLDNVTCPGKTGPGSML